jgi:hypothetical protein
VVMVEPVEVQPVSVVPSRLNPFFVDEATVGEEDTFADAEGTNELGPAVVTGAATGSVRRPAVNPRIPTRTAAKAMTSTMSPVGFRGAAGLDHG